MGIYNTKYLIREADELDSVQDPDNPGVDLDQIEKDIVGDGNEAHSEEIEDADSGVIDDPLEEAYMIMYESEYNYNQLLQVIGIRELSEATRGREFILEAVDIKGFFSKVKKFITDMFKKITNGFKNVVGKLRSMVMNDKKFIAKYKNKIIDGERAISSSKGDFNVEIYTFPESLEFKNADDGESYSASFRYSLDKLADESFKGDARYRMNDYTADKNSAIRRNNKIKAICGVDASEIGDVADKLKDKYFGEKVKAPNAKFNASTIIDILSGDKEVKEIEKSYNTIKSSYKNALNEIDKMEKEALAAEKTETGRLHISTIANDLTQEIKFSQNLRNITYSMLVKAAKAKRNQARKLANAYVKASGGFAVKKEQTSYTGGIFSSIELV